MQIPVDNLWKALEAEGRTGQGGDGGWLVRIARPRVGCPLFLGLDLNSRRRAILLRLPTGLVPARRAWPRCKGLEPLAVILDGHAHFGVALKEPRFVDVFSALTEDLVRRVIEASEPSACVSAFLGQLARWQRFLSASTDGLSEESQRGLWGELHFLRNDLLPVLGVSAVIAWKGGSRTHQDFQFPNGAAEVKTTLAKKPQVVRITSERQLDDSAWSAMFLHVIALDVRERGGESLAAMVASVRAKLAADSPALDQFDDALLTFGYLAIHEPIYAEKGYLVRSTQSFRIKRGFPRLVERDLPEGVGDVSYGLAVAACASFAVTHAEMALALKKVNAVGKNKKTARG